MWPTLVTGVYGERKVPSALACPTFELAWVSLVEEELSWAAYKTYKIVNVHE